MTLAGGIQVAYRALVVCSGPKLNWGGVSGLRDALGRDGVCSNYSDEHAEYTWRCIKQVRSFTVLHATPPQSAPDFIRESPLANEAGWVAVEPATLQHTRYANIFSLGDAVGTTNAKTAAAVRLQAPVVVRRVVAALNGGETAATYDGYGSCSLTTAYGEVVLAEFTYGGKVAPSFPLDPRVPRRSAWWIKTRFLPHLYWSWMLRGSEVDVPHRARSFADAA